MEGTLELKGKGSGPASFWRKRYCVFHAESQLFEVFKSVGTKDPTGDPAKITAVYNVPNRDRSRRYRFDLSDARGVFHALCAPDDENKQRWLAAFREGSIRIEDYRQHPRGKDFASQRKKKKDKTVEFYFLPNEREALTEKIANLRAEQMSQLEAEVSSDTMSADVARRLSEALKKCPAVTHKVTVGRQTAGELGISLGDIHLNSQLDRQQAKESGSSSAVPQEARAHDASAVSSQDTQIDDDSLYESTSSLSGFICPNCLVEFPSAAKLVVHFSLCSLTAEERRKMASRRMNVQRSPLFDSETGEPLREGVRRLENGCLLLFNSQTGQALEFDDGNRRKANSSALFDPETGKPLREGVRPPIQEGVQFDPETGQMLLADDDDDAAAGRGEQADNRSSALFDPETGEPLRAGVRPPIQEGVQFDPETGRMLLVEQDDESNGTGRGGQADNRSGALFDPETGKPLREGVRPPIQEGVQFDPETGRMLLVEQDDEGDVGEGAGAAGEANLRSGACVDPSSSDAPAHQWPWTTQPTRATADARITAALARENSQQGSEGEACVRMSLSAIREMGQKGAESIYDPLPPKR